MVNEIWDFIDKFISPIHFIPDGDENIPPGYHHGTGWFLERNGMRYICTCEHVARDQARGKLGYAPFGGDHGIEVGSKFSLESHPIDIAIAEISRSWDKISHTGKCIPFDLFDLAHCPVAGEYLYMQGFPGVDSKAVFGEYHVKGLGAFLHEVEPPPELFLESPPFDTDHHICMAWSPANATPLVEPATELSSPGGMSGSVLWNTRFEEAKKCNRKWSVNDMRVTGIVWGSSSKATVTTATKVENFYSLFSEL